MTTVVFLHGSSYSPLVWRPVADHLPPDWGVAAPNLFGAQSVEGMLEAVSTDITTVMPPGEKAVIVSESIAAIPAVTFAVQRTEQVAAIVLAQPELSLSPMTARAMKIRSKLLSGSGLNRASSEQHAHMLDVVMGQDVRSSLSSIGVPVHLLMVERAKPTRTIKEITALRPSLSSTVVPGAERDWFDYAPREFAQHVSAYVRELGA